MSFFKVERGWQDSPMFGNAPYSDREAWLWMVGEARYEDGVIPIKGLPMPLKRGQLYASVRFMAQKFQWSKDRVTRFLNRMKTWGSIDVETATGQNLITICNYSEYQDTKDAPKDSSKDTNKDSTKDAPKDKQEEIQEIQRNSRIEVAQSASPIPKKSEKGKRLGDWLKEVGEEPTGQQWGQWAKTELGLNGETINREMAKFCDYWKARSTNATKLDWTATWRNWCRTVKEQQDREEKRNELFRQRKNFKQ